MHGGPAATGGQGGPAASGAAGAEAAEGAAQSGLLWPKSPTIENPLVTPSAPPVGPLGSDGPAHYPPQAPGAPGFAGPGAPVTGAPMFGAPVSGVPASGPPTGGGPEFGGPPGFGAPQGFGQAPFGTDPTGAPVFGAPPPARRRGPLIALLLVVFVLLAAGTVGGIVWLSRDGSADEPTASGSPKPMKPAKYKEWLASVDSTLAPLYKQIVDATTVEDVKRTASAAAEATRAERQKFIEQVPPVNVQSAHAQMGTSLTLVADDLLTLTTAPYCTFNAARLAVGQGTGGSAVRAGAEAIAASDPGAGYKVGTFLPQPPTLKVERPANGFLFKTPATARGGGDLRFENNTTADYLVVVVEEGANVAFGSVYVHSGGGKAGMTDVPDRKYTLYYATGTDWDADNGLFLKDCKLRHHPEAVESKGSIWTFQMPDPARRYSNIDEITPDKFPTWK
ncbi:hypothetical protein Val02_12190 [Virgisporangium aliadipatigenens]|uniref:Uncharacterized protein n=1 Tax=Virgisporangium aliadipatigenens TaxID=741659 RepID=A0A8J3YI23_9ACTN|nr:hypothetical protein [Virgisporangium aliadipatigenens]GIJ44333.1 hypothetical protein Val02_12190 [Virgisporangium aliadipatigenens]